VRESSNLDIMSRSNRWIKSVAFNHSIDGALLATSGGKNKENPANYIRFWDPATGKEIFKNEKPAWTNTDVICLAFSSNDSLLAYGSYDDRIRVWEVNMKKNTTPALLEGTYLDGDALSVAFSPDDQYIAAGSSDSRVRIWNVASQKREFMLEEPKAEIRSVAFSPDGKYLACGASDNCIYLWDRENNFKFVKTLCGHTDGVWEIVFNPANPRLLASASWDGTVRLWEVETEGIRELTGHRAAVRCLAFSPDGKLLASGSRDRTVRLWEVESGEELDILKVHKNDITGLAFSAKGNILASGSLDGTIRFRDLRYLGFYNLSDTAAVASLLQSATGDTSARLLDLKYLTKLVAKDNTPALSNLQKLWQKASYLLPRRTISAGDSSSLKTFDTLFQRYLYLLPFRKENLNLVEAPYKFYLQPANGYQFPQPRQYRRLQQPRSPGLAPIEWVLKEDTNEEEVE
jgi:WD40 repeat protein